MDEMRMARARAEIEQRVERFRKLQEQFNAERDTYSSNTFSRLHNQRSAAKGSRKPQTDPELPPRHLTSARPRPSLI